MTNKFHTIFSRRNAPLAVLAIASVATSFSVGMHSSGQVQPFTLIEAGSTNIAGDMDGDGDADLADAIAILEIAQGYDLPSPEQLIADPNGDGTLTVDDALRILSDIAQS